MEKEWIVRLTHKIPVNKLDKWCSAIKRGKYKTKELQAIKWIHHYELRRAFYTQTKIVFPVTEEGKVVVEIFWSLAPEKGWMPSMAVGISWEQTGWQTELTPDLADHLIHLRYFPCFSQQAVTQALKGEKLLQQCQQYHRGPEGKGPPSLQYLALRTAVKYGKVSTLTPTTFHIKNSTNDKASTTTSHAGSKRGSFKTLHKRRVMGSLESLCRPSCPTRLDRRTSMGGVSN
ncbi:vif protein [Simian immunodeficiency virus]|uniref:Virion infectivity factor n=1 Tax=Simian immunodeficiency virus TaxID=11723 RepID=Q7SN85_SIV|nr:Vif [Simian immunodeficiency virus]AAT68804.1 vif protein [Simian immunodeficiency virus]